jgi:hypothetical protein
MIAVISFIRVSHSRLEGCAGRLSSWSSPPLAPHRKCIFYADGCASGFEASHARAVRAASRAKPSTHPARRVERGATARLARVPCTVLVRREPGVPQQRAAAATPGTMTVQAGVLSPLDIAA